MENANFYLVEYTDTFCGEANYCWVNRFQGARQFRKTCGYKV